MARRNYYLDDDRMYSDMYDYDGSAPQKSVQYYKKVEKTTKTLMDDGENPRTHVVSTTIVKENDNPEQITQHVYTTGNYGTSGYDEDNQHYESLGDYENSNGYEEYSRRFESMSRDDDGYTGLQPSYLNSNKYQSNTYKNRGAIQTTRNIITSSNSINKTYLGNSALNIPKNTGYISNIGSKYSKIESYQSKGRNGYSKYGSYGSNRGNSYLDNGQNKSFTTGRANLYLNINTTETENKVTSNLDNEDQQKLKIKLLQI